METIVGKGPSAPEVSQHTDDFVCLCYGRLCVVILADGDKVEGIFKGIDFERGTVLLDNVIIDKNPCVVNKARGLDVVKVSLSLEDIWYIDWTGLFVGEKVDTLAIDFSSDYTNPVNMDTAWVETEEEKQVEAETKSPAERWQNFALATKGVISSVEDDQSGRKQPRAKDKKQGNAGQERIASGRYEPPHMRSDANRSGPRGAKEARGSQDREGGSGKSRGNNLRQLRQQDPHKKDVDKGSAVNTEEVTQAVDQAPAVQIPSPPPPVVPSPGPALMTQQVPIPAGHPVPSATADSALPDFIPTMSVFSASMAAAHSAQQHPGHPHPMYPQQILPPLPFGFHLGTMAHPYPPGQYDYRPDYSVQQGMGTFSPKRDNQHKKQYSDKPRHPQANQHFKYSHYDQQPFSPSPAPPPATTTIKNKLDMSKAFVFQPTQ